MIILKAFKDLTLMKNILHRELPQSINVLGGLHHMLQNNVFQLKMCVDSWPTFSTAICYRQNQNGGNFKESHEKYSIFSKNQNTLRRLLTDDKLQIKWRNGLEFEVANHHSQIICEIASLRGFHVEENGGYHSYINYSPDKLNMSEKTSTLATSTLNESHVELVVQQLPFGGRKENFNLVEAYIKHLPNCCVVDEKGHPVSWLLTDEFNCLRMSYTQPKYRRNGHLQHMMLTLIGQRISEGLPAFTHIHKKNAAPIGLANKAGFIRGDETTFMIISDEHN
ncbi:glycine N-acyltransferase-like isoform X1 [Syngnathus acus]|uniref:glycine N-acyltransferase-like isoform X1 n=1 Tax=Syngnathus acus TaxID=161584 RepID=UPI001885BBAD|nr:glycine N-acyltransferase-like isoform X1 [Syngnathus acus]